MQIANKLRKIEKDLSTHIRPIIFYKLIEHKKIDSLNQRNSKYHSISNKQNNIIFNNFFYLPLRRKFYHIPHYKAKIDDKTKFTNIKQQHNEQKQPALSCRF